MLARLVAGSLLLQALDEVGRDLLAEALRPPYRLPRFVVVAGMVEEHGELELGVAVPWLEPGGLGELGDRVGNALHARQHEGDPDAGSREARIRRHDRPELRERLHV